MPEIVEQSLRARGRDVRVIRPSLSFRKGLSGRGLVTALLPLFRELGVNPLAIPRAVRAAAAAQEAFHTRLIELGRQALDYAHEKEIPSVVVCGPLHVIHDSSVNATIPTLLRQNGAMAIPMDCFPTSDETAAMEKVYWGEHNRYLRAAAAARAMGNVFPLMLSSFGCGPASFTEQIFQSVLEGYPHTILESDGHGGTAGFVTRIQAFLQSVRQFVATANVAELSDNSRALAHASRGKRTGAYLDHDVRYVFLSSLDYMGPLFAAVYRSAGYDAVAAPPLSEANFACGRRDCSGKECLSYQMVWGAFRQYLEENPPEEGKETRLVQISGESCRAGLFGVKDRITLDKLGYGDRVTITSLRMAGGAGMSARLWAGLAAVDIIRQLYLYHLVIDEGEAARLYHDLSERVVALVERRSREGLAAPLGMRGDWRELKEIVTEASQAFRALGERAPRDASYRTVFVSGDLMTKGNDFANGGVYLYLGKQGIRVLTEPACDFIEFLARAQPHLIFGKGGSRTSKLLYKLNMVMIRKELYGLLASDHPWLPMPDVRASLDRASEMIATDTNGGAALAVGSVLHHYEQGGCDGVVMTACWGCDNGLVAESLLRHRRDIPIYFFYEDATPIDERRLLSFAFRLRRGPAAEPRRPDGACAASHRLARCTKRALGGCKTL